jgi:hypothetical protein
VKTSQHNKHYSHICISGSVVYTHLKNIAIILQVTDTDMVCTLNEEDAIIERS